MIDPEGRLWAGSGDLYPGRPYTWHITDLDQRKTPCRYLCTLEPVEDVENRGHLHCSAAETRRSARSRRFGIRFSKPVGPITYLTDRKHDMTYCVNNYPLSALDLPFPVNTIFLRSLTEVDRLGPMLTWYTTRKRFAFWPRLSPIIMAPFKYWYMDKSIFRTWYELNSWSRLPRDHPHIVSVESVVLGHHRGGIVGFTTRYIAGGTLHENNATTRLFLLRWLHQLLSVVDDLYNRFGVMHQDVAARNLVVGEDDNLRIFDFNYSVMIETDYTLERDDMKGVIFTLYEIITLDENFREISIAEQDAEAVLKMKWENHPDVKLDADVDTFRHVLDSWVAERKAQAFFTPADTWVRWPEMPDPPAAAIPTYNHDGEFTGTVMKSDRVVRRKHLVGLGKMIFDWERPASYNLRGSPRRKPGRRGYRPSSHQHTVQDLEGEAPTSIFFSLRP